MFYKAKSTFFAAANSTYDYVKENPEFVLVMGVGTTMVVAPVIVAPAIAAAGFGANGVVAGSAAAGVQSIIGNVAANSAFAVLQSYGAGGVGTAVVHGVVQGAGAGIGAVGSIFHKWNQDTKDGESDSSDGTGNSKAEWSGSNGKNSSGDGEKKGKECL